MRKQYLHLSVRACDKCRGPVVSGSFALRENEISKETDQQLLEAICLVCGDRPPILPGLNFSRDFAPVEWPTITTADTGEMPNRIQMSPILSR
jgi:hypothetical protein